MKIPQFIRVLAAKYDCYPEELVMLRHAMRCSPCRYYTRIEHVSRSGMSRTIIIKYLHKGELWGVSAGVYALAGCDKSRRISGCGMDMLFAAQSNLWAALWPRVPYQRNMLRYQGL